MIVELDLKDNLYSEAKKRATDVIEALAWQRHFNDCEDSDHEILAQLQREVEEGYEWFQNNAPWWIPSLDRACVGVLIS